MNGINPIVRIDLDYVRESIGHMLTDRSEQYTAMVKDALERELTPEKIQSEIDKQVRYMIQSAITDIPKNHALRHCISNLIEEEMLKALDTTNEPD